MRRALVVLLLALCLDSTRARADTPPSVWDRAVDPLAGERYRLHVRVSELMEQAGRPSYPLHALLLERARSELEQAGAAASPDPLLRFDLGAVYFSLNRYADALEVLEPALAMAPKSTSSADAWLELAFAAAHLDRSELELKGYDEYMALGVGTRDDLTVLSNRAEAEMRLGNLDDAIEGYREVIDRAEHRFGVEPAIGVLARWGLAVALDRNNDAAEADHEAFEAEQRDADEDFIGDHDSVFFVPEYERDWYYAVGRTQHAKHETDPERQLACWSAVVDTWTDYVSRAVKGDRWVALARAHLADAEREQKAAAVRASKARPREDRRLRALQRRRRPC